MRATILIDALDESGDYGRMISLLVDLDNVQRKNSFLSIIVTTRPEPAQHYSPLCEAIGKESATKSSLREEKNSLTTTLSHPS